MKSVTVKHRKSITTQDAEINTRIKKILDNLREGKPLVNAASAKRKCELNEALRQLELKEENRSTEPHTLSLADLGPRLEINFEYVYPGLRCDSEENLTAVHVIVYVGSAFRPYGVSVEQETLRDTLVLAPRPEAGKLLNLSTRVIALYNNPEEDFVFDGPVHQVLITE